MPSTCGEVARNTDVAAPCSGVFMRNAPACLGLAGLLLGRRALLGAPVPLQRRPDAAGHERVGGDAVGGPATGQLDGEQHVGGLGLAVRETGVVGAALEEQVVEDHGRGRVAAGGHRDDAGARRPRPAPRAARSSARSDRGGWSRTGSPSPARSCPAGVSITPALLTRTCRGPSQAAVKASTVARSARSRWATATSSRPVVRRRSCGHALPGGGVAHGEGHLRAGVRRARGRSRRRCRRRRR